jgi:hypothetical protein
LAKHISADDLLHITLDILVTTVREMRQMRQFDQMPTLIEKS